MTLNAWLRYDKQIQAETTLPTKPMEIVGFNTRTSLVFDNSINVYTYQKIRTGKD